MLLSKLDKNIVQVTWRYLSTHVNPRSVQLFHPHKLGQSSNLQYLKVFLSPNSLNKKYSTNPDPNTGVLLPPLTKDEIITFPSFFKSVGNFVRAVFVIKPFMDKEFNIADFIEGSREALSVVSNALSREDYESIKGLVTDDTIQVMKNKISLLSPEQKQLIAVNKDDICISFPYEIGIMFDKDNAEQRFVEITVVHHSIRGGKIRQQLESQDQSLLNFTLNMDPSNQNLIFVSNFRFIRELTKDVESSWTINMINHASLACLTKNN